MKDFEGLVSVVTGGCSGIGRATVDLLLARGSRVAVIDRTISELPSDVLALSADVSDRASIHDAISEVVSTFGQLDILVNNAGIGAGGQVDANSDAEWEEVFNVNVFGMARVSSEALPFLKQSKVGSIVNVSSVVATVGVPNRVLYSASKGAVTAMTLAMAGDHVKDGIRVNAVTPGTADTPWVARLLDQAEDAVVASETLRARQPMGRLVTAPEIAHAIVYLASPLSASTTGTILAVDGGMSGLRL